LKTTLNRQFRLIKYVLAVLKLDQLGVVFEVVVSISERDAVHCVTVIVHGMKDKG